MLFTETDGLLDRDLVEGIHAELNVLVDALAVGGHADLDGYVRDTDAVRLSV